MRTTFVLILFSLFSKLPAQPGCTDPQALNYDINATENDGSCTYPMTDYSLNQICELPNILEECSGAEWIQSGLWVLNDNGNENEVYRIDSLSGDVLETTIIANVENIDWEDLTENEDYLYVGDFGNNDGNRTDLAVYRINKNDLSNNIASAELINFEFSDQVDFSENSNNHNFDCEAIIFFNNQLHLFSKNWEDSQTKHYTLSPEPGTHVAQLKETFNVEGFITSADINDDNELVLLGYTVRGFSFLWLLFDFDGDNFFSGNKRRIDLGFGLTNSQTEGIAFRKNGYGYIVSEQFKVNDQFTLPQKMLSFSIDQWVNGVTSTKNISVLNSILVYPNPIQDSFEIKSTIQKEFSWKLYNEYGRSINSGKTTGLKTKIDATNLSSGTYYLLISEVNNQVNFTLLKE